MTFRDVVKNIAKQHGLYATFMPKPFAGENGSAMHFNQSLFKDGQNIFFDPDQDNQLSDVARSYIAGLLKHAKGMTAITNPIINSYKRLKPGYEAPTHIAWSSVNRSTADQGFPRAGAWQLVLSTEALIRWLIRIWRLRFQSRRDWKAFVRTCSHRRRFEQDVSMIDPRQLASLSLDYLPRDLYAALQAMEADELVRQAIGDHCFTSFNRS